MSEQQKQSEMRGEYSTQVAMLKENIAELETQIVKYKTVSFIVLKY